MIHQRCRELPSQRAGEADRHPQAQAIRHSEDGIASTGTPCASSRAQSGAGRRPVAVVVAVMTNLHRSLALDQMLALVHCEQPERT